MEAVSVLPQIIYIFLFTIIYKGEYIIMLWPDAVRVATSKQKQCVIVAEEAGGREGSGT